MPMGLLPKDTLSIDFLSATEGWAIETYGGAAGSEAYGFSVTLNGGKTWTPRYQTPAADVGGTGDVGPAEFSSMRDGTLALFGPAGPAITSTTDGGRSFMTLWSRRFFPKGIPAAAGPWQPVVAEVFHSQGLLVFSGFSRVVGRSPQELLLYRNRDGKGWQLERLHGTIKANVGETPVLDFISTMTGYLVTKSEHGTYLERIIGDKREPLRVLSGAWLNHITMLDFINAEEGWALVSRSHGTALSHTMNGGATWTVVPH